MSEEKKQKRWKMIVNVVTLSALGLLIYLVRNDVVETINKIDDIRWWVLLLMVPVQALNFYTYTLMYYGLLRFLGFKLKVRELFKIALELNFVNHVFPSGGVSGFSYFSLRLRPLGVTTGTSTLIQLMRFVLVFVSFQVLLVVGVLALAFSGAVNNFVMLISGSIATMLIIGTLILGYVIGSKQRINMFFTGITRLINKLVSVVHPKRPEAISIDRAQKVFRELHENYLLLKKDLSALKKPLIDALFSNITEIITLYLVFVAFDFWVNPGAVILAYAVANFAGLISILPGGVGVYEALMTAVLTSTGVPAGVSFPIVLMYRITTMIMQLPPGYLLYHKAVQENAIKL